MKNDIKNILVIKTSSLGDVLHCFPAVSLLKAIYPQAKIHWLVNKNLAEIVEFHPAVWKIIQFDRYGLGKLSPSAIVSLRNSLKEQHYELAFDFQGLLRNALCGKIAKVDWLVGFKRPRERISLLFYDQAVDVAPSFHAVERNCLLVCNYHNIKLQVPKVELKRNEMACNSLLKLLDKNKIGLNEKIVIVAPCARWESKTWPAEFFTETIKMILNDFPEITFVLCGGKNDIVHCAKISVSNPQKIKNLAGETTLSELVELIRHSLAMICCDTGPMHIAAALDVPVFALFGPTSPTLTGPYGDIHTVFQAKSGCINCFKRYCKRLSDRCHDKIKPEEVQKKFKEKIGSKL